MQEKGKSILKIVIIILSILLAVSLLLLAGTIVYNHFADAEPVSVTVPDNIISPDKQDESSEQSDDSQTSPGNETDDPETAESAENSDGTESTAGTKSVESPSVAAQPTVEQTSQSQPVKATALSLHNRRTDDNTPFEVGNMFPGDAETEYYCVKVSYKGNIVVRFHADVRPGYEKLAEVLRVRVRMPESNETLYDGLMRDMPESLNHELFTSESTQSELYYEITAYLDTSVGNEYMDKDLIADFNWWVEETENLDPPQTGDTFNLWLWICIASGSLFLLILLWRKRKKEDAVDER